MGLRKSSAAWPLIAAYLVCCHIAFAEPISADDACSRLLDYADRHGIKDVHADGFSCRAGEREGRYFIVDLHQAFKDGPPEWVGSTLLGWYAVRIKDGAIFEYDMANESVGRRVDADR